MVTFRKMYAYERDLNLGPKALSKGYELLGNKALAIQYEEFVSNQDTKGRMGDPTGVKEYRSISMASLKKWKATFDSNFRKQVAFDYLNSIGDQTLSIQGYDKTELLSEVQSIKVKFSISAKDRIDIFYTKVVRYSKVNVMFGKKIGTWARSIFLS